MRLPMRVACGAVSTRAWNQALVRAGIERTFRWHDPRHTWASWHVQNGTPLQELMELGQLRDGPAVSTPHGGSPAWGGVPDRRHTGGTKRKPALGAGFLTP